MIRDYTHAAYLQERHDRANGDTDDMRPGFVMQVDPVTGLDMRIVKARAARAAQQVTA